MNKIIKRAGLEPWPKTFQNLRSTRETELCKLTGNVKAVCTWIGNSPDVALKHYAQITEADQREAVKRAVLDSGKKTVQNPVQIAAANCRTKSHEVKSERGENLYFCGEKPEKTKACDSMREADLSYPMGRAGLELNSQESSQLPENKEVKDTSCLTPMSETVHDPVHISVFCPELQQIIDQWDSLPEHIKAAIKALIQSHNTEIK